MPKTRDYSKVIRKKYSANPRLRAEVEKQLLNLSIAALIFRERSKAELTQSELAERAGTHQSVIARLEDADYGGHSLTMLWRIADALDSELKLEFAPKNQPAKEDISVRPKVTELESDSNTVEIVFGEQSWAKVTTESS